MFWIRGGCLGVGEGVLGVGAGVLNTVRMFWSGRACSRSGCVCSG